jgi:hypothetical protein
MARTLDPSPNLSRHAAALVAALLFIATGWRASSAAEPSSAASVGSWQLGAPSNDHCAGAETIVPSGAGPWLSGVHDITDATTTGDPAFSCGGASRSRSLWYTYTPVETGPHTISTCASDTATTVDDTILGIYLSSSGTCAGTFSEIAGGCDDDGCGVEPAQGVVHDVLLHVGRTYLIVVWKKGTLPPTAGNSLEQLSIRIGGCPPPPPPLRWLFFSSQTRLVWEEVVTPGDTDFYDVLRGEFGVVGAETCLANDTPDAFVEDGALPAPDGLFWYLLRLDTARCEPTSWGGPVTSPACP